MKKVPITRLDYDDDLFPTTISMISKLLRKDKSELYNYLIDKFYNDGYHGIQEIRVIWDISVIAYLINRIWFKTEKISCQIIKNDTSYTQTQDRHKITIVNYLDVDKIYTNLFKKLGEKNEN